MPKMTERRPSESCAQLLGNCVFGRLTGVAPIPRPRAGTGSGRPHSSTSTSTSRSGRPGASTSTITAYRHQDRTRRRAQGRAQQVARRGVPRARCELITLGRTLKKRVGDVLAYFDRPGTSNRPTEAINGRLEHLHSSALGFRDRTNHIERSLPETGGFRPRLRLVRDEPGKGHALPRQFATVSRRRPERPCESAGARGVPQRAPQTAARQAACARRSPLIA